MPGGTDWRKGGGGSGNKSVEFADDQFYLQRIKEILQPQHVNGSLPQLHPVQLLEHVFIGSQRNADNVEGLRQLGITHVLNCAGLRRYDFTRSPYHKDSGIKGFLMFSAEDHEDYDMKRHFPEAIAFLDDVRRSRGRALVHCNLGVNRSGAVAAAYLMVCERRTLLDVIEYLRSKRTLILSNKGFRRQLIMFARERSLLDPIINTNSDVSERTRSNRTKTPSPRRSTSVTPSVVISDMSSSSSSSAGVDEHRNWSARQANWQLTPVYEQQMDGSSTSGSVLGGFLTLFGAGSSRRKPLRSTSYSNVSYCAAGTTPTSVTGTAGAASGSESSEEQKSLSTTRPLRVYTRSSTDTELYRRGGRSSRSRPDYSIVRQQFSEEHGRPPT